MCLYNYFVMTSKGFGNKIYAYTDEDRYEGRIANGKIPRVKIGETGRDVEDRVEEQDNTSQPVRLIIKRVYTTKFSDKDFHFWLEGRGYIRPRKNREWFEITV